MFAVVFEVHPAPGGLEPYMALAASLRPELERTPGFVSIERWKSLGRPGWILSLSLWQDEAALTRWRVCPAHHDAQVSGRGGIFSDYRLRVAQVIADDAPPAPPRTPHRRSAWNDPAARAPRFLGLAQSVPAPIEAIDGTAANDRFASLVNAGRHVALFDLGTETAAGEPRARAWQAAALGEARPQRVLLCEVERDYGMFDRAEAPQYYPPIAL